MMATKKRQTKEQREAVQKAELLRRVTDVYSGAIGKAWERDDFATAENLSKVIPALKDLFGEQDPLRGYVWELHCLNYFDNPRTATEHLFSSGFRA